MRRSIQRSEGRGGRPSRANHLARGMASRDEESRVRYGFGGPAGVSNPYESPTHCEAVTVGFDWRPIAHATLWIGAAGSALAAIINTAIAVAVIEWKAEIPMTIPEHVMGIS